MKHLLPILFVLISLNGISQTVREINMVAEMDKTTVLDDGTVANFWGFGYIKPNGSYSAEFPGPTLNINKGDSVNINVFNASQETHTIHLHGLDVNQANDGVPSTSFQIGPTETETYSFNANHAGVFLYHCHVLTTLHLTMGMYGMIVVNNYPDSTRIFDGGPSFTNEYRFLSSDMDVFWNTNSIVVIPELYKFRADYFMINGKSGNQLYNSVPNHVRSYVGDTTVLRLGSMAYNQTRYIFPEALNAKAYMSDGRVLPNAFDCDTLIVNSGERYTVVLTPSANINTDIQVEYYEARNHQKQHTNFIKLNGDLGVPQGEIGDFDIYPNPANDQLTFRTFNYGDIIEIFDLSGKKIKQQQANHYITYIDIADLNVGVYILKYQDKTLKVVKQ